MHWEGSSTPQANFRFLPSKPRAAHEGARASPGYYRRVKVAFWGSPAPLDTAVFAQRPGVSLGNAYYPSYMQGLQRKLATSFVTANLSMELEVVARATSKKAAAVSGRALECLTETLSANSPSLPEPPVQSQTFSACLLSAAPLPLPCR